MSKKVSLNSLDFTEIKTTAEQRANTIDNNGSTSARLVVSALKPTDKTLGISVDAGESGYSILLAEGMSLWGITDSGSTVLNVEDFNKGGGNGQGVATVNGVAPTNGNVNVSKVLAPTLSDLELQNPLYFKQLVNGSGIVTEYRTITVNGVIYTGILESRIYGNSVKIQFTTNETLRPTLPLTDSYIGRVFWRDSASNTSWYNWTVNNESHYLIAQKEDTYKPMVNDTAISYNPTKIRRVEEANSIQVLGNTSIMFERLKAFEGELKFDFLQSTGRNSWVDLSFQMSTDNINWVETQLLHYDLLANNETKESTPLFIITTNSTNGLNECRYCRVVVKNLVGGIDYKVRLKCVEI